MALPLLVLVPSGKTSRRLESTVPVLLSNSKSHIILTDLTGLIPWKNPRTCIMPAHSGGIITVLFLTSLNYTPRHRHKTLILSLSTSIRRLKTMKMTLSLSAI